MFIQVPASRVFCSRKEPAKDILEGGRVERGGDLLPVFVREETVRAQPVSSDHPRGEHDTEGDRGPVRQQADCHKRSQGKMKQLLHDTTR